MGASVVDLFCGVGGLTCGFIREGLHVAAGIDIDPACEYPYAHNNRAKFVRTDVNALTGRELEGLYAGADVRILAGCAPCQPFSSYSRTTAKESDDRWKLLNAFARLVGETRPAIVTMENVTRLRGHTVYSDFVAELERLDYYVTSYNVACPDYGMPQTRRRLVLFASLSGPVRLIPPTHKSTEYMTVRQAIGSLERLGAGEASKSDRVHKARSLGERNLRRIKASVPGGSWEDWDEDLVTPCHRRQSGSSYRSVYGRMEWDAPSPTITTQCYSFGTGRFGHPEQDRSISLREAALLQTFPAEYQFVAEDEPVHFKTIGRLIGNAVPVRLGEIIAKSIRQHLEERRD